MTIVQIDPNMFAGTGYNVRNFKGLSTDTKPTSTYVHICSIFFETDTGKFFIYNGTSWVQISNN